VVEIRRKFIDLNWLETWRWWPGRQNGSDKGEHRRLQNYHAANLYSFYLINLTTINGLCQIYIYIYIYKSSEFDQIKSFINMFSLFKSLQEGYGDLFLTYEKYE